MGPVVQEQYHPASIVPTRNGGVEQWRGHIDAASRQTGVPAGIIEAVMQQESSGNYNALSPVGAIGLMQLMPGTAAGLHVNPHDPAQNVLGGARYLRQMYDQFGSWEKAIAAYNAGPGAVQKYGGIPPFDETRDYVKRIRSNLADQAKR